MLVSFSPNQAPYKKCTTALKVISVNCTKFTVNDQLPLNYFAHYTVLVIINHSMWLKTINRRLKIDVLIVFDVA